MIPVIAVVVGAVFGGEVLGLRDIAGALLVLAGVWLSMSRGSLQRVEVTSEPHLAV
jgi:drug/metabolite transporter (DMT)-like permease